MESIFLLYYFLFTFIPRFYVILLNFPICEFYGVFIYNDYMFESEVGEKQLGSKDYFRKNVGLVSNGFMLFP